MPRFTTISPTHKNGQKPFAWERFRAGNYVAIGWLHDTDLTAMSQAEIAKAVELSGDEGWKQGKSELPKFVHGLRPGDLIAVTNGRHDLFGVGKILSGYKFGRGMHDAGGETYSHYRKVEWFVKEKMRSRDLVKSGETGWKPRGTLGKIFDDLPPFALRIPGIADYCTSSVDDFVLDEDCVYPQVQGQGYCVDPIARKLLEERAISVAIEHYRNKGYTVTVKGKPYDLCCKKGPENLFVEVKGTTSRGGEIFLTRNEVEHAKAHSMHLFVLSDIDLVTEAGKRVAKGGKRRIVAPWAPEEERLEALTYRYFLE